MNDNSFWEAAERMMSMGLLADGVRGQPGEEREAVRAKVLERTAKHLAALHDDWAEEGRRAGRAEAMEIVLKEMKHLSAGLISIGSTSAARQTEAFIKGLEALAAKERGT